MPERKILAELEQAIEKFKKKQLRVEDNFHRCLDFMPLPVLIADTATDTLVWANDCFCRMHGYQKDELLDKPVDILIPPTEADLHVARREAYMSMEADAPPVQHNITTLHKNGTLVFLQSIVYAWRTNGDKWLTLVGTDGRCIDVQ